MIQYMYIVGTDQPGNLEASGGQRIAPSLFSECFFWFFSLEWPQVNQKTALRPHLGAVSGLGGSKPPFFGLMLGAWGRLGTMCPMLASVLCALLEMLSGYAPSTAAPL